MKDGGKVAPEMASFRQPGTCSPFFQIGDITGLDSMDLQ